MVFHTHCMFIRINRERHNNLTRIQINELKHAGISSFLSQTCSAEFALLIFFNIELVRLLYYHSTSEEPRRTSPAPEPDITLLTVPVAQ